MINFIITMAKTKKFQFSGSSISNDEFSFCGEFFKLELQMFCMSGIKLSGL